MQDILINWAPQETRVAVVENGAVQELHLERELERGRVGNIYIGKVARVLPGMQSAFIDLGLERDGFLYVSDVIAPSEEFERFETEDESPSAPGEGGGAPAGQGPRRGPSGPPGRRGDRNDREKGPEPKIEELLKEGQEIIVQVAKEPLGTKGARLTSHASMPGRFLVFMPTVDHVGVSRKIDSREERSRLRGTLAMSTPSTRIAPASSS